MDSEYSAGTRSVEFQGDRSTLYFSFSYCKHLVDRLNADRLEIHGRVERLDLIWSDRDLGELPTVKRSTPIAGEFPSVQLKQLDPLS
jgi:hypothetical protein